METYTLPNLSTHSFARPLFHLPVADSTQDIAKNLIYEGAKSGTAVLADTQTQGRGRQGRNWFSVPGSQIFLSIITEPSFPQDRWPILNIATGLALTDSISPLGPARAQIKWPNDVLVNGKKVAGILSEVISGPKGSTFLVLGIGINVSGKSDDFPEDLRSIATTLHQEYGAVDRLSLLSAFLGHLEEWFDLAAQGEMDVIRNEFAVRWAYKNVPIEIRTGTEAIRGVAQTIDPFGALIVEDFQGKQHRIFSGDIQVRPGRLTRLKLSLDAPTWYSAETVGDSKNLFAARRENHFWLWLVILGLCGYQYYQWREIQELRGQLEEPREKKLPAILPPARAEMTPTLPSPSPTPEPIQTVLPHASSETHTPLPSPLREKESTEALPASQKPFVEFKHEIEKFSRDFDAHDLNKNSQIEPLEAGLSPDDLKHFDLNRDGRVTKDEFLTAQRLLEKGLKWVQDHNLSGEGFPLLEKDFDSSPKRFRYMDGDHDGSLTEQEYFEFQIKRRMERKRLDMDRNGDVSTEEFGQGNPRFDVIDENKNGALDEVEIGNALIKGIW